MGLLIRHKWSDKSWMDVIMNTVELFLNMIIFL